MAIGHHVEYLKA